MFFRVSEAYHLTDLNYNFLYLSSSLSTLLGLTVLINYYVQTSDKAERYLISVNQKLSEKNGQIQKTLTERNYAFECLDEELSEAANYVRTLLPPPIQDGSIRVDWRFVPSTSLGGDAFGYYWLDEDHFAIYLIDVSGHGVGAALLSVSVINTLRSQSLLHTNFKKPEMVLDALNKAFPGEKNNDMFFTIWYGVYNKNTRELSYASGGHPPALLMDNSYKHSDTIKHLRTPNFIIGGDSNAIYNSSKQLIGRNNKLYIFSDGVYEIKKINRTMWRFKEFTEFMGNLKTEKSLNLDHLVMHAKSIGLSKNFEDDFTIIEIIFD
jgi:phosphoserine phosphatase RsbU/P